jgi:hypothetical protein
VSEPVTGRPALRVISGSPSAEELAALLAVVTARSGGEADKPPRVRRGGWSDPAALRRRPLLPGPNGWRAAAW